MSWIKPQNKKKKYSLDEHVCPLSIFSSWQKFKHQLFWVFAINLAHVFRLEIIKPSANFFINLFVLTMYKYKVAFSGDNFFWRFMFFLLLWKGRQTDRWTEPPHTLQLLHATQTELLGTVLMMCSQASRKTCLTQYHSFYPRPYCSRT